MAKLFQLPTAIPGTEGVLPNFKYFVSYDNLSQITTAGYLNTENLQGFVLNPFDIIQVLYSFNPQNNTATYGIFYVSIFNGLITLTEWQGSSNSMRIDSVNTMKAGSSIVAYKVNGTEASNAVTASGMSGVITTSALTTVGGGTYAITWTNSFISSDSTIILSTQGGTNTVPNFNYQVVPGSGTATITIFNNTAATALNGTIKLGYLVI